jgi:hypothetical protein
VIRISKFAGMTLTLSCCWMQYMNLFFVEDEDEGPGGWTAWAHTPWTSVNCLQRDKIPEIHFYGLLPRSNLFHHYYLILPWMPS